MLLRIKRQGLDITPRILIVSLIMANLKVLWTTFTNLSFFAKGNKIDTRRERNYV